MSTDPVTLTRTQVLEEMRAWGWVNVDHMIDRMAELWPNGVRIVPDPIPEPGPEVRYVEFETPEEDPSRWGRSISGWMELFGGVRAHTWAEVLKRNPVSQGYSLTEYVAKDGAK